MAELAAGFQSLPAEYQNVIRLAQDQHKIAVTPLQALAGGWSGAMVYLVSIAAEDSDRLQHLILKLDRKNAKSQSDEIRRHETVMRQSPLDFAEHHLAQMVFERVEVDGAMAIFYSIAGQSLHRYRTLSSYEKQSQIETIFADTYQYILSDWNAARTFKQAVHPAALLEQWLSFRLKPDGNIQNFLETYCHVAPDIAGFLVQGSILPNPLAYARKPEWWGAARPIDVVSGLQHGDLNTNNILIKFAANEKDLDGYFLIDFALFKEQMPLIFDLRYLEMSYLILRQAQVSFTKLVDLIVRLSEADSVDPQEVPIDVAGLCAVIGSMRREFERWVSTNHPSLHDDLWGQYWLAGVAAGLSYCHKPDIGQPQRLIGLIYAAANLKRYSLVFGMRAPTEARQLYDPVKLRHDRTATITMRGVPHNLPAQTTPLVGREKEVAAVEDLLMSGETRLITLSGPGGVGKTRLSLEVTARTGAAFPDGIFFVPLADITDATLVVSKIAQTLGVREGGGRPLIDTLKAFLHEKRMLLVLDNFEQLVPAASMITDLLAASPRLKILVSSRIVLEVRGEHEFVVPPLETPTEAQVPELNQLEHYEQYQAVQLFIERAQTANPKFSLTTENVATVVEICQRLDGLPLAIELAAARIKMLTPQAILSRLGNRLDLLTGGARDLPVRQQTLRNSLDLSYGLLRPEEQQLFARLGVFIGGFTLETAEAVCGSNETANVLEGVTALMNNSFLRSEDAIDGQPRFRMLETIREYALEHLKDRGEAAFMQEAHARYYLNRIADVSEKLFSPDAQVWLNWLESEHANIGAALAWGLATAIDMVAANCRALTWYWYRRGYYSEGRAWSQRLLTATAMQGKTTERALAFSVDAALAMWQGDLRAAEVGTKVGLELAQQTEDLPVVAWALLSIGVLHINMGKYEAARLFLKEALDLFTEMGHNWFMVIILVHLGNIELGLGNVTEARNWLDKAYVASGDWGEDWTHTFVLNNLGEIARVQGDYEKARDYYEESAETLRALGDKGDLARLTHSLGYIEQHEGNFQRAEAQFRESLAMFRALGNKRGIAECLLGFAALNAMRARADVAAHLLGVAEATMNAIGASWWPADHGELKRTRAAIQSQLGETTFAVELAKGKQMSLERAIANVTD